MSFTGDYFASALPTVYSNCTTCVSSQIPNGYYVAQTGTTSCNLTTNRLQLGGTMSSGYNVAIYSSNPGAPPQNGDTVFSSPTPSFSTMIPIGTVFAVRVSNTQINIYKVVRNPNITFYSIGGDNVAQLLGISGVTLCFQN